MIYELIIDPAARLDLLESTHWYNQQQPGLGRKFYESIYRTFLVIKSNPHLFQIRYKEFRMAPVKKFPFMVLYLIDFENKKVAITAVMHTSRNPQLWKDKQ